MPFRRHSLTGTMSCGAISLGVRNRAKSPSDRVWLSEIMLQQTTVKAVAPYFGKFLARWPTVRALAAAPRDDVLAAWAGLGYYSRARNLHACAQVIAKNGFPPTEAGLRELPGVGAYTSAAIAAIAFDEPAAVVDGNVERVLSRVFALEIPLPAAKPFIRQLAATLTPDARPGDYAQAMMDLGATICTPRSPSCLVCPVRAFCAGVERGDAERFPLKAPKSERPVRRGTAYVIMSIRRGEPCIFLRQRPDKGLLGGMMEVPCSEWLAEGGAGTVTASSLRNGNAGEISTVFATLDQRLLCEREPFSIPSRTFISNCAFLRARTNCSPEPRIRLMANGLPCQTSPDLRCRPNAKGRVFRLTVLDASIGLTQETGKLRAVHPASRSSKHRPGHR